MISVTSELAGRPGDAVIDDLDRLVFADASPLRGSAEPKRIFSCSAVARFVRSPMAMSLVTLTPPSGTTDV